MRAWLGVVRANREGKGANLCITSFSSTPRTLDQGWAAPNFRASGRRKEVAEEGPGYPTACLESAEM